MTDDDEALQARSEMRRRVSELHRSRQGQGQGRTLIYVAAQHPLVAGSASDVRDQPGLEFRSRLDRALNVAEQVRSSGAVPYFLVCGDVHRDEHGVADAVSLRAAGMTYLRSAGIPVEQLVADDLLSRYRPDGVYCTEDEVAVAAGIFRDDASSSHLIGVCGQAQALRVLLAAENEAVPMQVETPLVWDEHKRPVDPTTLWHQPGIEALQSVRRTALVPADPQPLRAAREALKSARAVR